MFIDQLMDVDMVIAETFQIYTSVVTSFDGFDIQQLLVFKENSIEI